MAEIFIQLGLLLGIALVVSLVTKLLKQPLIIGYIITGIIVGPSVAGIIGAGDELAAFSHLGVALLLFIVGLGLKPTIIKEVGKTALITGIAQIVVTTAVGYYLGLLLGLTATVSFYLSFAFALSSTIIVMQMLYVKQEQDTLYGRIAIGFLLVQDLAALIFFVLLSSTETIGSGQFISHLSLLFAKLGLILLLIWLLVKYAIPHIDRIFARSKETLFIFALAVCFTLASFFYKLNFSVELGALLAGVILSTSPYQREIATRLEPLRDFFLIIFFIILGTNIDFSAIGGYAPLVIVFSFFILIGNPIILILIMRFLNYTAKVGFLVGLTVAQISEFSLIILGAGVGLGHLPKEILGPATLVGLITIAGSTYFINFNHKLYQFFRRPMGWIFCDNGRLGKEMRDPEKYEVILFGSHRLGGGIIEQLKKMKVTFIVVDHDPEAIARLIARKIPCLYGAAEDYQLLDGLPLKSAALIVSTIPELDVNISLIDYLKNKNRASRFLCIANHAHHAAKLYKAGAAYVIVPPYLGRRFMIDLLKKHKLNFRKYHAERRRHLIDLPTL
jgi:Kef-type K+ transport system membrane component KefB